MAVSPNISAGMAICFKGIVGILLAPLGAFQPLEYFSIDAMASASPSEAAEAREHVRKGPCGAIPFAKKKRRRRKQRSRGKQG